MLTNKGTEFRNEFQEMLDEALINHRRTSREHPQVDGLAERMVQTLRVALRKACLTEKSIRMGGQAGNDYHWVSYVHA